MFGAVRRMGLQGIVSKRIDAGSRSRLGIRIASQHAGRRKEDGDDQSRRAIPSACRALAGDERPIA
jgi:hypothetical protein